MHPNYLKKKSIKLSQHKLNKLYQEAFERDGWICQTQSHLCIPGKEYLVGHHIIPKGRLRLDILENILTVCICHIPLHAGQLDVSVDDLIEKYNLRKHLQAKHQKENNETKS